MRLRTSVTNALKEDAYSSLRVSVELNFGIIILPNRIFIVASEFFFHVDYGRRGLRNFEIVADPITEYRIAEVTWFALK